MLPVASQGLCRFGHRAPAKCGPSPRATLATLQSRCRHLGWLPGRGLCSEAATEGTPPEEERKRIVVAVGGNALIRRGERLTIENQLKAARKDAAPMIRKMLETHEVVLTHGNGPQVGELALERSAATFDVLGAESQGQIGYIFSQALAGVGITGVPIVTQVMVDPSDPAFQNPTKFVGPVYGPKESEALSKTFGWSIKPDGEYFRRVVPSPPPLEILQIDAVRALLSIQTPNGPIPIACGGGGVPVTRMGNAFATIPAGSLEGIEAVIDKDNCGALLANQLEADGFVILTDGGGIFENFGKPNQREMEKASAQYLRETGAGKRFPGSMGPKIAAAIRFVEQSSKPGAFAAIGDLSDASDILEGKEGTLVLKEVPGGVIWREKAFEVDAMKGKLSKLAVKVPRNP